jgi:hypothetical protein
MMLQEIKNQLRYGNKYEYQKKKYLFYLHQKIGGQLEILVLVDQILKSFIGFEKKNFLQIEVM